MADNNFWTKLLGGAEIVLGGAFVYRGIAKVFDAPNGAPLLGETKGREKVVRSARVVESRSIEQTAGYIIDRIRKDSLDGEVKTDVMEILTRKCGDKWCVAEKSSLAEINAIWDALKQVSSPLALRYTRDHYAVDQFSSSRVMKRWKGEDCDGMTIRMGAMLRAVGYPLRIRIVEEQGVGTWSHIFLKVGTPPSKPTRWMALDLSVVPAVSPGWEVPGAEECARTGRPAGQVARVKDFDV